MHFICGRAPTDELCAVPLCDALNARIRDANQCFHDFVATSKYLSFINQIISLNFSHVTQKQCFDMYLNSPFFVYKIFKNLYDFMFNSRYKFDIKEDFNLQFK